MAVANTGEKIINIIKIFRMNVYKSTISCPYCGYKKEETMPEHACQYYYECVNCKGIIKPKKGDCCVFCSYGTVKCPSKQMGTYPTDEYGK